MAAGLGATDYLDPAALDEAFDRGVVIAGILAAASGILAFVTIVNSEEDAAGRADVQLRARRAAGSGDVRRGGQGGAEAQGTTRCPNAMSWPSGSWTPNSRKPCGAS